MSSPTTPQGNPSAVTPPDPAMTPPATSPPSPATPARRSQFGKKGGSSRDNPSIPGTLLVIILIAVAALLPVSPFALSIEPIRRTVGQIFFNAPAEARLVILVLLAVFTLHMMRLLRAERRLRRERADLEQCRRAIAKSPDPLDESHLAVALAEVSRDTALARVVQGIYDSRLMQTPNLSAITESVTQAEVSRSYQGRHIGNILMLTSLLGTVFGLTGTIANLKPQLAEAQRSGRLEDLLSNLEGTLTTMGTAFASTAWGILLAVTSTVWANGLTKRREDLLADIERFAITELAPRLLPSIETNMVEQMRRLVETSRQAVTHNQQLVLQIETTVHNATKDLHRALTEAGEFVVEAGKASLDVATQLDRILGQFPTDLENALGSLLDSVDELKGASAQITRTYASLSDSVRQLEAALTAQKQGIETTIADQRAQTASLMQGQEQWLITQRAAMEQQTRDMANALATQADILQHHLDATTKEVSSLVERIDPKLPNLKDWQDLRLIFEQSRAISQKDVARLSAVIGQSVSDGIGQGNDALRQEVDALQQKAQGIHQTLTLIARSLEEMRLHTVTTHTDEPERE